jgi:thiamine-monophosphate kinase
MNIGDLGEFELIHRFAPPFCSNMPHGVEGIGNDCAVIPYRDNLSFLVTTDLLVENSHFIKTQIPPEALGYKSLAVNLSDIAAMGGRPQNAFLSLGLPKETPVAWIDAFFSGFRQLAKQTGVLLLGGDTTRSSQIIINVLLIGVIETQLIKRRSQAIAGDIICCTGYLGNSGAGLNILLKELPQDTAAQALVQSHFYPRAHLEEGAWLSAQPAVHAMMDLSDGLSSDIQRIMEESKCGAHLEVERLPLSPELVSISDTFGWSAENLALTGGEDYCLLVTIDPNNYAELSEEFLRHFQRPIFQLGTILSVPSLVYTHHQKNFIPEGSGFDHFKSEYKKRLGCKQKY